MKNMAEHCTGYIWSCFVVCFVFFLSFRLSYGVLYSSADHTVLLENDTISNVIHNSQTAWVVEFYSSFCGHCHAFAPTWKKLAKMAKGEFTTIYIYPQIEGYDDAKRFSISEGVARYRSLKSDPSARLLALCLDIWYIFNDIAKPAIRQRSKTRRISTILLYGKELFPAHSVSFSRKEIICFVSVDSKNLKLVH